jgi:hypothetical protein
MVVVVVMNVIVRVGVWCAWGWRGRRTEVARRREGYAQDTYLKVHPCHALCAK